MLQTEQMLLKILADVTEIESDGTLIISVSRERYELAAGVILRTIDNPYQAMSEERKSIRKNLGLLSNLAK